ncbi:MAG: Lrp/AsnC family transcriptional regulator [Candidatus Promineifilaceae bacterium]
MEQYSQIQAIDKIDRKILVELQNNGRLSNVELARRVHLSPPATHARVRRLEERGIIKQYTVVLDRDTLGFDLLCFIHIRMQMHELSTLETFQEHMRRLPEVLECHHLTGQFDYVVKVALRNRRELQDFVRRKLVPLKGVSQITTSVLLEEVKSTTKLPLEMAD